MNFSNTSFLHFFRFLTFLDFYIIYYCSWKIKMMYFGFACGLLSSQSTLFACMCVSSYDFDELWKSIENGCKIFELIIYSRFQCPPLAYAIAEHSKNSNSSKISRKYEFDVIALADKIKWKSGVVKNELKQCEWQQGLFDFLRTIRSFFLFFSI